jgi:hypothetical protein
MARSSVEERVARAVRAELLAIVMAPDSHPDDVLEAEGRLATQATDPEALAQELVSRSSLALALEVLAVFERHEPDRLIELTPGCMPTKPPA